MKTKRCSKCGEEKALDEFYRHKASKDGRRPDCKTCSAKRHKTRYDAKRSEILEQLKTPEVRARRNATKRAWDDKNRDKLRRQSREYYSQNRERLCQYQREWRRRNKGKVNEYKMNRLARVAKAVPTWADRESIRLFYENCPEGYHVDHIIPLRGDLVSGLHVLENLQYLPAVDNLKKSNRYDNG